MGVIDMKTLHVPKALIDQEIKMNIVIYYLQIHLQPSIQMNNYRSSFACGVICKHQVISQILKKFDQVSQLKTVPSLCHIELCT